MCLGYSGDQHPQGRVACSFTAPSLMDRVINKLALAEPGDIQGLPTAAEPPNTVACSLSVGNNNCIPVLFITAVWLSVVWLYTTIGQGARSPLLAICSSSQCCCVMQVAAQPYTYSQHCANKERLEPHYGCLCWSQGQQPGTARHTWPATHGWVSS